MKIFNRLAFNIEETVYDVFENDEETPKYYLDGVDQNDLLFYVDDINAEVITNNASCSPNVVDNLNKKIAPESAFDVARKFIQQDNKKTHVLNSASATIPEGGFLNGEQAQEESLSRQSALYISLINNKEMYCFHRINDDDLYTDSMFYSPDVPVFRDDKDEDLLSEIFKVDVLTSAPPNKASYQKKGGKKSLKPLIENRCRKIVQCAIDNNNDVLVLCAYGFGVLGNDPKEIIQAFKKILVYENYGKYFDKVVFAIPGQMSNNFRVFSSEFH